MTHEQADQIILLMRACNGSLADIADAIREAAEKAAPKKPPSGGKRGSR